MLNLFLTLGFYIGLTQLLLRASIITGPRYAFRRRLVLEYWTAEQRLARIRRDRKWECRLQMWLAEKICELSECAFCTGFWVGLANPWLPGARMACLSAIACLLVDQLLDGLEQRAEAGELHLEEMRARAEIRALMPKGPSPMSYGSPVARPPWPHGIPVPPAGRVIPQGPPARVPGGQTR